MINREKEAKMCSKCEFKVGKYCKWWNRKDKEEIPPCQFTKEKTR